MNKYFVQYDLALLAKQKGFDEPCLACVWSDNEYGIGTTQFVDIMLQKYTVPNELIKAPLYDQLRDWLLREHKIIVVVSPLAVQGEFQKVTSPEWIMWNIPFIIPQFEANFDYYTSFNAALKEALNKIK